MRWPLLQEPQWMLCSIFLELPVLSLFSTDPPLWWSGHFFNCLGECSAVFSRSYLFILVLHRSATLMKWPFLQLPQWMLCGIFQELPVLSLSSTDPQLLWWSGRCSTSHSERSAAFSTTHHPQPFSAQFARPACGAIVSRPAQQLASAQGRQFSLALSDCKVIVCWYRIVLLIQNDCSLVNDCCVLQINVCQQLCYWLLMIVLLT